MDEMTITLGMEDAAYLCEALEMLKKKKLADAKYIGNSEFKRHLLEQEAEEIVELYDRIENLF